MKHIIWTIYRSAITNLLRIILSCFRILLSFLFTSFWRFSFSFQHATKVCHPPKYPKFLYYRIDLRAIPFVQLQLFPSVSDEVRWFCLKILAWQNKVVVYWSWPAEKRTSCILWNIFIINVLQWLNIEVNLQNSVAKLLMRMKKEFPWSKSWIWSSKKSRFSGFPKSLPITDSMIIIENAWNMHEINQM